MLYLWFTWSAHAADLEVGGAGYYADISSALAAAVAGDRLLLHGPSHQGSYRVETDGLTIEPWPGDSVTLLPSTSPGDTTPVSSGFVYAVGVSLTLRDLEIDGQDSYRLARVSDNGTLTLDNIIGHNGLRNGANGGALLVEDTSTVVLLGGEYFDNACIGRGGVASVATDATLSALGTRFAGNSASSDGGALFCRGRCLLSESVFVDNFAANDGGAIFFQIGGGSSLSGSRFCGNIAGSEGGGISVYSTVVDPIEYNVFWGNTATHGGAADLNTSNALYNNDFIANLALSGGSVLYVTDGSISVWNSLVLDHPSGVMFDGLSPGSLTINNVLYDGNTAAEYGLIASELGNRVDADPQLLAYDSLDCEGSDLHLSTTSPALGEGDGSFSDDLGAFGVVCPDEIPADGIDQDCNGVDLCYLDADGDGYGRETVDGTDLTCAAPNESTNNSDCNDARADVHPGQPETIADAVDANCDGRELCWRDEDGDLFGSTEPVEDYDMLCLSDGVADNDDDCDDTRPFVSPAAPEQCDNGIDDDCDLIIDYDFIDSEWFQDADGDTFGDPDSRLIACLQPSPQHVLRAGDCDDEDAAVHPDAPEICDTLDQNCNGQIDETIPTVELWPDSDGDGYGSTGALRIACLSSGFVENGDDCNDQDAEIFPGSLDTCDGLDNDCDGAVDNDSCLSPGAQVDTRGPIGCQCDTDSSHGGSLWLGAIIALLGRRSRRGA